MLKKQSENKNENGEVKISPILQICIVLTAILIILSFASGDLSPKKQKEVDKNEMTSLFEKIKDNYTLNITINKQEEQKELSITTDGKLMMYDGDYISGKYLKYNSKYFEFDETNRTIKKIEEVEELNNLYFNIELIKNISKYCTYEYIDENNTNCKINIKDYINEYNALTEDDILPVITNDTLTINIRYTSETIDLITIDYELVDVYVNQNNDSEKHQIKIKQIDKNDYTDIYDYFKAVLES